MPKDNLNTDQKIADTLATVNTAPISTDPDVAQMQKGLMALQLRKLSKEIREQEEAEESIKEWRRQNALSADEARQKQVAMQALCPHLKPNGQPAIGGQRDHSHNYIFVCAYCTKQFDQHTLPSHLRIPAEWVGGPTV